MQRGDQKPVSLAPIQIRSSGFGQHEQTARFPTNRTPLVCTFFIKNGEPEVKTATITLFICDERGGGSFLAAQGEINLARHFGNEFKSATLPLKTQSGAEARGFVFRSLSYSVGLEPQKAKHAAAMNEVVQWRQQLHQEEEKKAARDEQERREEQVRLEAHRREKARMSEAAKNPQQIRGLASFQNAPAPQ